MCGRYASTRTRQDLIDFFDVDGGAGDEAEELEPDFNVAPTKPVPVVLVRRNAGDPAEEAVRGERGSGARGERAPGAARRPGNARELHVARWGLVPFWAKDASIGARMINARVETAHEKPAFRRSFALHRCIMPADGYYEWEDTGQGVKQPHFIRPADGGVLPMAGLYAVWRSPDGGRLLSCTVITTEATDDVGRIHDRMPMLVEPERFAAWLDPALTHPDEVRSLLVPAAAGRLESHPVSTAVNKVTNNSPELVDPAPQMGISSPAPLTLF